MLVGLLTAAATVIVRALQLLTGFVGNGSTFPQPLSDEEEARYIALLQSGDPDARNVLVERNLRLVAHIVKKFDNTGEDVDDLISIGTVGLIKGISTFNPAKGTKLATYAARCIENEILMHLRCLKRNRGDVSIYDPIGVDHEGNEITYMDVLFTEADEVSERVDNHFEEKRLRERISRLDGKERKVVELRYGLTNGRRWTQREIAWLMGVSRSYVSRIEKKAVGKLCKDLNIPIEN
jgi:RNA polymerase sporulation-specific sigma factor